MENRIIKFRGRRKLNGDWVYGSLLKSDSEDWDYILDIPYDEDNQPDRVRVISKTVGQFTGVNDMKGNPVYEGDLVRVLDRDWPSKLDSFPNLTLEEYIEKISAICEVVYSGDRFELKKIKEGCFNSDLYKDYGRDRFEVIGNIHEHPDLLSPSSKA